MAALTGNREITRYGADADPSASPEPFNVAASVHIYSGSLLFLNSSAQIVVASPDQTMTCVGYHEGASIDNSAGSAGDKKVLARRGVIDLANNGSSIAADDVGKLAYAVDNQTVDLSSNSSTRPVAGTIAGVRSDGRVWVKVGTEAARSLQTLEAVQPIDADLTAIAALSGTGLIARTGAGTAATRTLTAGSSALAVSDGNGVSGNPTVDASAALTALSALAGTGFITQTGGGADNGSFAERSLTAGSAAVTIANGNGVSGNPSVDVLGIPTELADPGDGNPIPVTRSSYVGFTFNGTETNTLADPAFIGQKLILNADTATSGSRAVTAANGINQAGNTVMTFAAARDVIVLEAIKVGGALRWQVTANDGVALS